MEDYSFASEYGDYHVDGKEPGKPWWESVLANKDKLFTDEQVNSDESQRLWMRIQNLEKRDIPRIEQTVKYENFYNISYKALSSLQRAISESSYNVIRANCNTAQSKLGKEMPKVTFLTDRGMFSLRHAAKMLDEYIEAEFERSELFPNVRMCILDACVSRLGIIKILFDKKKERFVTHRVRPTKFLVDDSTSIYNKKSETFEKKEISVASLVKMFPNMPEWQQKKLVEGNRSGNTTCYEGFYADKVKIYFTKETILSVMPWEGPPPYFYWRWTQATNSFWGVSITDELRAIQRRINDILLKISRSIDLFAVPRVVINTHDNITGAHVTNELGAIIKISSAGDGASKVQFLTPPILDQQYFQHLEDLYMKSFQETGISQLSSTGQKPKGLNSGRALLAYHDIQTDRFAQASQNLVDMYVEIARYMAKTANKFFRGKKAKEGVGALLPYKIKWKELDIEKNIYQIKQYPTNLLSKSPAGRLEDVQMLINMGVIPPEKGIQLLEFPDITKAIDMLSATDQAVESLIERLVRGEKDIVPDPNLPMGRQIETAQKTYGRMFVEGADDDTLERVQEFIVKGKEQIKKEIEEQQAAQGAATAAMQQGQDVQAPAGPMAAQMPGNLPAPPAGGQAAMPMNQGGMR